MTARFLSDIVTAYQLEKGDFRMFSSSQLSKSWRPHLASAFESPYMKDLESFLSGELNRELDIYPGTNQIFRALDYSPLNKTKVVILGQDPYHGQGQANGLCFSVEAGVPLPPSLKNIYKELQSDLNITLPNHGSLDHWAKQGILMLNSVLTVEKGNAGSHANRGWEQFTDLIIKTVNDRKQNVVFFLWGNYAQKKGRIIDPKKHLVLKSAHPSPLSSYRGFFGSKPFSKTNQYLKEHGQTPIDWNLPLEG